MNVLRTINFFRVVAVADKNFSDSCYKLDGLLTYSDYVDLFALDIDVLFVSLPNDAAPDATRLGIKMVYMSSVRSHLVDLLAI